MWFPVLMYHRINGDDRYSVSEYDFSRHMFFLSRHGYRTLLPRDLPRLSDKNGRFVMVTFDDGFESDILIALPHMRKYGYRGASFVTTGFVGRDGYMDWDQIKTLAREGFEIGSHTHSHALLNTVNEESLRTELVVSRRLIEEHIGQTVTCLALPGGGWKRGVPEAAAQAGYSHVFTSEPGLNDVSSQSSGGYRRMLISGATTTGGFMSIISGEKAAYRKLRCAYRLRNALKSLVGQYAYHSLWSKYYKYRVRGTERSPVND